MKKATTKVRAPSASSLREMPELDFAKYRVRRNPYAARIAREGIEVVHHEPSKASLREMPEADFTRGRVRRAKYATRAAEAAASFQYGRGRPRKAEEVGPTEVRSLRLPVAVWRSLEAEASAHSTTVHALLREMIATYVMRRG